MARPLTGQREMFRRLQENNEAKKERINQVRELGGLDPLEEAQHHRFLDDIEHYLEQYAPYRGYQRDILQYADDNHHFVVAGPNPNYPFLIAGRPNRNHTAYTDEAFRRITREWATAPAVHKPNFLTDITKGTLSYIADAVNHINPCFEIFQSNNIVVEPLIDSDFGYPPTTKTKLALRKLANMKLENNDDFAFLLNNDE